MIGLERVKSRLNLPTSAPPPSWYSPARVPGTTDRLIVEGR